MESYFHRRIKNANDAFRTAMQNVMPSAEARKAAMDAIHTACGKGKDGMMFMISEGHRGFGPIGMGKFGGHGRPHDNDAVGTPDATMPAPR